MDAEERAAKPASRRWLDLTLVRLLLFFVVLMIGLILVQLPVKFIWAPRQSDVLFEVPPWALLAVAVAQALYGYFAYRLLMNRIERRVPVELTAPGGGSRLIQGIVIGVGLFLAVYAVFYGLGDAKFESFNGVSVGLLGPFALSLGAGVFEEILFRGVIFRIVEQGFGTLAALIVSAALFGLAHAFNPSASLLSIAAIAIEAGLLLALAYSATRSLWLTIGLHFAWNFSEGGIFGASVSGFKTQSLFTVPLNGPDIVTGGEFGPEASIVTLSLCVALAALFAVATLKRGQWVTARKLWRIDKVM